ncbi:MAG: hypothetical protein EOO38_00895 [Cytophagaceae bacterium]|nr:MAG: hypothetical protein EOO38_00895 [Cytophagaceae bacterium]
MLTDAIKTFQGKDPETSALMAEIQSEYDGTPDALGRWLLSLMATGLRGPAIWIAYKDFCQSKLGDFLVQVDIQNADMIEAATTADMDRQTQLCVAHHKTTAQSRERSGIDHLYKGHS